MAGDAVSGSNEPDARARWRRRAEWGLGIAFCGGIVLIVLSPVSGLIVVPGLAFGTYLIRRFRLVFHTGGYLLTAVAWAMGPLVITESLMSIAGAQVPRALSITATAGVVCWAVWFWGLAMWPRLLAKGARPQESPWEP